MEIKRSFNYALVKPSNLCSQGIMKLTRDEWGLVLVTLAKEKEKGGRVRV